MPEPVAAGFVQQLLKALSASARVAAVAVVCSLALLLVPWVQFEEPQYRLWVKVGLALGCSVLLVELVVAGWRRWKRRQVMVTEKKHRAAAIEAFYERLRNLSTDERRIIEPFLTNDERSGEVDMRFSSTGHHLTYAGILRHHGGYQYSVMDLAWDFLKKNPKCGLSDHGRLKYDQQCMDGEK